MKRAKHNLSHYRLVTADMGECFPIGCVPVLPGDTVQQSTNALVRLAPLNTPVMHPTQVRIHHFFVPNRIVWDSWEDFITGGPDGIAPSLPTVTQSNDKYDILSYLGVPPIDGTPVNALPLYAFNKIYNEYYRDQDFGQSRGEDTNSVAKIAWEKDYFSTARPWAQRGPEVTIPIGDTAPVVSAGAGFKPTWTIQGGGAGNYHLDAAAGQDDARLDTAAHQAGNLIWGSTGLETDLSQASAVNVNEFRAAFALQRYQENRARYGARYTEYLAMMGVRSSDARLDRPEFLGGGAAPLNFSEVLQTSEGEPGKEGVGALYGHGIAGIKSNAYRKFFEEHGYVISVMSIRPKAIYVNGVPREFLKRRKEEFFQRELGNLGQQEIWQSELYAQGAEPVTTLPVGEEAPAVDSNWTTFGYQDRYEEYRRQPSQVSNDFRDLLNAWHMGRDLQDDVTLNTDFIECEPDKRIYQVDAGHSLWIMANHKIVARRLVPKRANPRII